jgi:hypothetical protein
VSIVSCSNIFDCNLEDIDFRVDKKFDLSSSQHEIEQISGRLGSKIVTRKGLTDLDLKKIQEVSFTILFGTVGALSYVYQFPYIEIILPISALCCSISIFLVAWNFFKYDLDKESVRESVRFKISNLTCCEILEKFSLADLINYDLLKDKVSSVANQPKEHKYIVIEKLSHAYNELKERIKLRKKEVNNAAYLEINRLSEIIHSAHTAGEGFSFFRKNTFDEWMKLNEEINSIVRGLSAPIYSWLDRQMLKISLESNRQKEVINNHFREVFFSKEITPLS